MIIRDVLPSDAEQIAEIYAPFVSETAVSFEAVPPTPDEFRRRIADVTTSFPWLVGEEGNVITGYAYASTFRARDAYRHTAETSVYVAAEHRGKGVGFQLMSELLDRLRAIGIHVVIAGATLPNPASATLHEKLGFQPVGLIPQVGRKFDQWHDVGFWSLTLDSEEPDGR